EPGLLGDLSSLSQESPLSRPAPDTAPRVSLLQRDDRAGCLERCNQGSRRKADREKGLFVRASDGAVDAWSRRDVVPAGGICQSAKRDLPAQRNSFYSR